MKFDNNDLLLYAITDRSWLNSDSLSSQVEKALQGGATMIQLREKNLDEALFLKEAIEIKKICELYHVPLIINDNLEVAIQANADGIHVGQGDLNAKIIREKLGPDKIIGVSAKNVEQALEAKANGANYLGVGAVFKTSTKSDATEVSREILKEIASTVKLPVVAIGGIDETNITQLKGTHINGVAVISAIFAKDNIVKATQSLKKLAQEVIEND